MERVLALLKKMEDLAQRGRSPLEIDLMMDHTRALYAELIAMQQQQTHIPETAAPIETSVRQTEPATTNEALIIANEITDDIPLEINTPYSATPVAENNEDSLHIETISSTPEAEVKQEEPLSIPRATSANADIRKEIGINDKYLFISELFGNMKDAYDKVLSELNGIASYDDAVDYLDENVHEKHRWEEDNDTVQSFYGVLNRFFSKK